MAKILLDDNGKPIKLENGVSAVNNLLPENIKKDVSILGVIGGYEGEQLDSILENNSWATIKSAVDAGLAPYSWVGQTKEIASGTYQGYHLQCVDVTPNRYEKVDGTGYTNAVFQLVELTPVTYQMTLYSSTAGGWDGSHGRSIMPDILAGLPIEIQNIISTCYTKAYKKNSNKVVDSEDTLFVPCESEITSSTSGGSSSGEGSQYHYYRNIATKLADRIKHRKDDDTARSWWTRSASKSSSTGWIVISSSGSPLGVLGKDECSISFCFAI